MARSFEILRGDEPDEDLAALAAQLGRVRWFTGNTEAAVEPLEFALEIAESLYLPEVLSEALNTKNLLLIQKGRRQESEALLRHSLRIAQEHGLQHSVFRAQFNLAYHVSGEDRYEEAQEIDRAALEVARRRGDRGWAWAFLGHFRQTDYLLGNWENLL
jgi:tetratricopeptide (TPR) repeat protein